MTHVQPPLDTHKIIIPTEALCAKGLINFSKHHRKLFWLLYLLQFFTCYTLVAIVQFLIALLIIMCA